MSRAPSDGVLLTGRWRDTVTDAAGRRVSATGWRANLVVDGAFTLLAGLLKRDPDLEGILFWAVGEGETGWDRDPPATVSRTARLSAEVRRLEVPREAIRYVDARGAEASEPTPDLELRLAFEWPDERVTLREFGIFGGDATDRPNSGLIINHVIHGRIDLEPGQRLSRELRLAFGRARDRRWLDVPPNWLSDSTTRVVDGVGERFAAALSDVGVSSVAGLAQSDPAAAGRRIPEVPLIELRSKARLALRTAAEIHPPEGLHELTVSEVLRTPVAGLARRTRVPQVEVVRLREQLSTLELALDHSVLGRMTVRALAGGGERAGRARPEA